MVGNRVVGSAVEYPRHPSARFEMDDVWGEVKAIFVGHHLHFDVCFRFADSIIIVMTVVTVIRTVVVGIAVVAVFFVR